MRVILAALVLLSASASPALAGFIDINYGSGCWDDGTPANWKTFACDTNSGTLEFTASFFPEVAQSDWVGLTARLEGSTYPGTAMPDWWQLYNAGACRASALSVSADFTAAPQVGCEDPFQGRAQGGISAYETALFPPPAPLPVPAANVFRLKVAFARPEPVNLPGGDYHVYYAFRGAIDYARTVGAQACVGCSTPLRVLLLEIRSIGLTREDVFTLPFVNNCLTWQRNAPGCLETPAQNSTWGQLKSLYR